MTNIFSSSNYPPKLAEAPFRHAAPTKLILTELGSRRRMLLRADVQIFLCRNSGFTDGVWCSTHGQQQTEAKEGRDPRSSSRDWTKAEESWWGNGTWRAQCPGESRATLNMPPQSQRGTRVGSPHPRQARGVWWQGQRTLTLWVFKADKEVRIRQKPFLHRGALINPVTLTFGSCGPQGRGRCGQSSSLAPSRGFKSNSSHHPYQMTSDELAEKISQEKESFLSWAKGAQTAPLSFQNRTPSSYIPRFVFQTHTDHPVVHEISSQDFISFFLFYFILIWV